MPRLNPDPRTPAHFRALRETLGMSNADIARILGVNEKSVHKWCFTVTAPDAAWDVLDERARVVQEWIDGLLRRASESGDGEELTVTVYPNDEVARQHGLRVPAAWHRAAAGIALLVLEGEGVRVRLAYPPKDM